MADEETKTPPPKDESKAESAAEAKAEKPLSPDAKRKEKKQKQPTEKKIKKVDYGPDFKYIVRIANTDLDGTKKVELALTGIKGVGVRMGTLIADRAAVPRSEPIGKLTDAQIEALVATVDGVAEAAPDWIVNRQFDWESGQSMHLVGSNVDVMLRDDLNRLKKIRSYRGVRHETGQRVRGQRTRSHGRTGLTVGVSRVKAAEAKKAEGKKEEEGKEAAKPAAPAAPAGGAKPATPAAKGGAKPAEGGKK